jgi:PAS domain S-box-containing protein
MKDVHYPNQSVFDDFSEGILTLDSTWTILFVNQAASAMMRSPLDEMEGRVLWEVFPRLLTTPFEQRYRGAMGSQEVSTFEEYFEPFGRWFKVRLFPVPEGLTVFLADTTDEHRRDEMIHSLLQQVQRHQRLASVLADTNEAVFRTTDLTSLFRDVTRLAIEVGGFVMSWIGVIDEETGEVPIVAWAGEGAKDYLSDVRLSIRDDTRGRGVGGMALRTGKTQYSDDILVDSNMAPWRAAAARVGYRSSGAFPLVVGHRVRGLLSVYAREPHYFNEEERDLAERVAASLSYGWEALETEAALQDSEIERRTSERVAELLSTAPDGIVALDQQHRLALVNEEFCDLFGVTAVEAARLSLTDLLLSGDLGPHDLFDSDTPSSRVDTRQVEGRRRDGTIFPVEVRLRTVDPRWGYTVVCSVRDVSERVALERERRELAVQQEREREDRLDSLGRLASGVAHDFNNLLGVVLMCVGTAESYTLPARVTEELTQIRRAAERGAEMVRHLMTFARQEETESGLLDVCSALEAVTPLLERSVGNSVTVMVECFADSAWVRLAPQAFDQVLLNLCINARDALSEGGTLLISVLGPTPDTVVIRVTDNGAGMTPSVLARAFEPFFTTKAHGVGTGLGLASVYGIVSRAGGTVALDSSVGEGTTVSVTLPRLTGPNTEPPNIRKEHAARSTSPADSRTEDSLHVLLVDDDDDLRTSTAVRLRELGWQVSEAVDGADAMSALSAIGESVDVVVTDVMMPRVDGIGLSEFVATHWPRLPVVVVTALPVSGLHGVAATLTKPVDVAHLVSVVGEVINGR